MTIDVDRAGKMVEKCAIEGGERREEGEEREERRDRWRRTDKKREIERRRMNGRAVWNLGNAHSLLSFFFLFFLSGRQSRLTGFLTSVGNIFGVIIA